MFLADASRTDDRDYDSRELGLRNAKLPQERDSKSGPTVGAIMGVVPRRAHSSPPGSQQSPHPAKLKLFNWGDPEADVQFFAGALNFAPPPPPYVRRLV